MSVAKHRTELTSDKLQHVHYAPYKAGPRAREFDKSEIDEMLKMKEIERAETESAVPIGPIVPL